MEANIRLTLRPNRVFLILFSTDIFSVEMSKRSSGTQLHLNLLRRLRDVASIHYGITMTDTHCDL
jgi:hypothetical protein